MSWNTVAKSWNLGPGSKSRQKRVRGWNWFDCQVLVPSSTFWFCISVLFCFCLFRLLKLLLHNIIRELWHSDAVQGPQGEKCSPSYLLLLARGRGPPHHARVYPTLTVVITSQYFMATLTWWWSPRPSWEVCSPSYLLLLTSSSLLIMPEFRWLHDFPTTSQLHNILQQPARGS